MNIYESLKLKKLKKNIIFKEIYLSSHPDITIFHNVVITQNVIVFVTET